MILLLDLCYRKNSLSRDEFVLPIARIVHRTGNSLIIRHYVELTQADRVKAERIILCGTSLKDNDFMNQLRNLHWLSVEKTPCLGICAGMQVLGAIGGGEIRENCEIGMTDIQVVRPDPLLDEMKEFSAYELHSYSLCPSDSYQVLATSIQSPQVIRHRSLPHYGVLFHPEVRNGWVVERFLHLPLEGMV